MKTENPNPGSKEPRLWPGVVIAIFTIIIRYLVPLIDPSLMIVSFFGGIAGGIFTILWWLFFSRVPWSDRLAGTGLLIVTLFITSRFVDESIARANMGLMFWLFSIPVAAIFFILWAVFSAKFNIRLRRITMLAVIILSTAPWICLRTNGMDGNGGQYFDWRWASTYEERVLAEKETAGTISTPVDSVIVEASWPGFRGPYRDGIARGVRINSDWSKAPKELWRKDIGPGCGSFAVMGNHIFTQEQRGENEAVSCYELSSGKLVWMHNDKARFYEPHAGAGPRSTPTLAGKRVYTLGATGILNALDAATGKAIWTRNTAEDTGVKTPAWGFCGSPLVVNDLVIASVSGKLAAYGCEDGTPRWKGEDGGECYTSPQLFKVNGKDQVVFMSDSGAVSVDPESGTKLWDYKWKCQGRILQAAMVEDGIFMLTNENSSIKKLSVTNTDTTWTVKDIWDSPQVKAYFNDFTLNKGYAYGYDGPTMTCTDLKTGKTMWRGNRYRGFDILFPEQDLIVILTEKGEVAVVKADPSKFTELIRFKALNGRTWNHPALARSTLLVRNDREMAAYSIAD
jgi:outer membrane protein assembly factor BamB